MEETANILCNMAYKLAKEASTKVPYYKFTDSKEKESPEEEGPNGEGHKEEGPNEEGHKEEGPKGEGGCEPTEKDYVSGIKKVKKENITPDNIGEIMLCQIPGLSAATAISIMEKFKTLSNLISSSSSIARCWSTRI
jgi:hypothetical protein